MLLCFTTHFVNINTNLKLHYGNFVISTHTVKADKSIVAFKALSHGKIHGIQAPNIFRHW